jgi:phosphohistidine phosphatase SixA
VGREQSKKIGKFFKENKIPIDLVISSEWCRCKETASIAFENYKLKNFLNSFYSAKFAKNKKLQMINLKKYVDNWDGKKNLILVTHYVVISEAVNYAPSSGEIVIADKNFKKLGNIEIDY